jgi:hypothetical protein
VCTKHLIAIGLELVGELLLRRQEGRQLGLAFEALLEVFDKVVHVLVDQFIEPLGEGGVERYLEKVLQRPRAFLLESLFELVQQAVPKLADECRGSIVNTFGKDEAGFPLSRLLAGEHGHLELRRGYFGIGLLVIFGSRPGILFAGGYRREQIFDTFPYTVQHFKLSERPRKGCD